MKKVHFIGIGGVSMSGLAQIMLARGYEVSGSDQKSTEMTKHLEDLGIRVYIGQKASNIADDLSLIVYTAAIANSKIFNMSVSPCFAGFADKAAILRSE